MEPKTVPEAQHPTDARAPQEGSRLPSTHLHATSPVGASPGCHLSPGVLRSSSLLQVIGSHQVILWDDADHVVELSDPPAIHVVLLGRHRGRDMGLVPAQGTQLRSRPLVPGRKLSSPTSPPSSCPALPLHSGSRGTWLAARSETQHLIHIFGVV